MERSNRKELDPLPRPHTPSRLAMCGCNRKASQHGQRFAYGHGKCLVEGCDCQQFSWSGWADEPVPPTEWEKAVRFAAKGALHLQEENAIPHVERLITKDADNAAFWRDVRKLLQTEDHRVLMREA